MIKYIPDSPDEIRDSYLTTYKNAMIARGVEDANILPGSDAFIDATALSNEIYAAFSASVVYADDGMPDTAGKDGLSRQMGWYGMGIRAATGASGTVTLSSSNPSNILDGTTLIGPTGQLYTITSPGLYANGDSVPVSALGAGDITNAVAGVVLRWVKPPPYASQTAVVSDGEITGGYDAEDVEDARTRFLQRLRYTPMGGNWAHVAQLAETSSTRVQAAFVYPVAEGGTTVHVACLGPVGIVNKSRVVPTTIMDLVVRPYVLSKIMEGVSVTVTTVADVYEDISVELTMDSTTDGWSNTTPWPVPLADEFYCDVTDVTSGSIFTVTSLTAPTPFATKIAWYDNTANLLRTGTVIACTTGQANDHEITIDSSWTNVATGAWVMPHAVNMQNYVDAILKAFTKLGPGQKLGVGVVTQQTSRKPLVTEFYPCTIGNHFLRAVSDAGDEVQYATFLYRLSNGASPAVPAAVSGAPKVYIPRRIAFYAS